MKNTLFDKSAWLGAFLLLSAAVLPAGAASQPFEYHADARMQHARLGPVEQAYGYMHVVTDASGNGSINVMFFNGSGLDLPLFNAHVRFLGAGGRLVGEEHFDCWLDAEGLDEAIECKVTKPLSLSDFESIEVDFYLSDVDDISAALVH